MKTKLHLLLALLSFTFYYSQTVKFVSANTGEPLNNVMVMNAAGDILAKSDIEGQVEKETLMPLQERYDLFYDGYLIATVKPSELESESIKLNDRERTIEPVVIKNAQENKYIYVRGHFNVYLVLNQKLNVYADGIATYVFDMETQKLKSSQVEQYRAYEKEETEKPDRKKMGTAVYNSFLALPDISIAGKLKESQGRAKNYTEKESNGQTKMQFSIVMPDDIEGGLFGYRMSKLRTQNVVSFAQNSKNLRDFQEFLQTFSINLKHKSEPNYNQISTYSTFIPTEISFAPKNNVSNRKIKPDQSSYTFEYWKANRFPNMLGAFHTYFKESLKEKPNAAKK